MAQFRWLFSITGAFLFASVVYAADIALSDNCNLADAIKAANTDSAVGGCPTGNGADVIRLTDNITLEAALPQVNTEITVEGDSLMISGDNRFRIFHVEEDGSLSIIGLTLTKGNADSGGAIYNDRGKVTIHNSNIIANIATSHREEEGGGAIYNNGVLNITDSNLDANSAQNGGAIFNNATVNIESSSFSGNYADEGGAIWSGIFDKRLYISGSSFIANSAKWDGGAIHNYSWLQATNISFSQNRAGARGGGIYMSQAHDTKSLWEHLTIIDNSAEDGGGIFIKYDRDGIRFRNSVLAYNKGGDCLGELTENIGNLIEDGSCFAELSSDPMVGDLVEPEDGSPAYFPLFEGSPAIDAARSDFCAETDQIDATRPQGAGCDIGAIEFVVAED